MSSKKACVTFEDMSRAIFPFQIDEGLQMIFVVQKHALDMYATPKGLVFIWYY